MTERRRPLKVGLQLPEAERVVRWTELAQMARLAEDVGFDSLWVGDHLLYRNPGEEPRAPWECWSMLSALAAITTRVELAPFVLCTAFRNPALTAKMADTLDEISGGRLILGLGAGWHEPEYRAFGIPFDERVSRFEEAFTIIRSLLRDGAVDFEGRFYSARDCELRPRGPRPNGPLLLVGSIGPRMLRITMPYVDAWNAWYADTGNSPEGVPALQERIDTACREVGRDPSAIERSVAILVGLPGGTGRPSGDVNDRAIRPVSGTPEEIAEALRVYARTGIARVQLVLDPITLASIEAMARVLEQLDRG